MADVQKIREKLGVHPDFPKQVCLRTPQCVSQISDHAYIQGIVFLDIFPILRDPVLTELLISHLISHIVTVTLPRSPTNKIDVVVGLDARGFILAPLIALRLGASFVPVRKKGKLPGETVHAEYQKEYGSVSLINMSPLCKAEFFLRTYSRCKQIPSLKALMSS
jgi:adenine phosphoribosyltransferase